MGKEKKKPKKKAGKTEEQISAGQLYQYDAFISYRHIQPDKAIAENLHKQLENFKLPKNVKASLANGHTKIERVFRDEDELPIASSLEDAIVTALQNSEWLIVICSPRILESSWCRLEISTFIRLHGRDHVLAVLVEGEPDEAIPEELLYEEVTTYNALGVPEVTKKRVEPLACDIRAKSTKKMVKNLESQKLRLLAKMFNLNYDDLRQRHREKEMRRKFVAVSVAAVIASAFMLLSLFALAAIGVQSQKVKAANEELTIQAQTIEEQSQSLLRSQAVSNAQNSIDAYASDDRQTALELAYASLTTIDDNEMPYTAIGERALAQALNVYADSGVTGAFAKLSMPGQILRSELSPDGLHYFALDNVGCLYVWDTVNLSNTARISGIYSDVDDNHNMYAFVILDNSRLLYISQDKDLHVYDYIAGTDTLIGNNDYIGLTINADRTMVCACSRLSDFIDVIDASSASIIRTFVMNDLCSPMANDNAVINEEGEEVISEDPVDLNGFGLINAWIVDDNIIYSLDDENDESHTSYIRVIDLGSLSIIRSYQIEANTVEKALIVNNRLYYISHLSNGFTNIQETIGRIDIDTNNTAWTVERQGYSSVLKCGYFSSGEVMISYTQNYIWMISGETGEVVGEFYAYDKIISISGTAEYMYIVTADNTSWVLPFENGYYQDAIGSYYLNSSLGGITTTQAVNIGVYEVFVGREFDNSIYVYRDINCPDLTPVSSASESESAISFDGMAEYNSVRASINEDDLPEGVSYFVSNDDRSVVIANLNNNSFCLFIDGELLGTYDSSYYVGPYFVSMTMDAYYGTDSDGNYYIANSGSFGLRISPEGEVLAAINGLAGYNRSNNTIIRRIDGEYYSQPVYSVDELIEMAALSV